MLCCNFLLMNFSSSSRTSSLFLHGYNILYYIKFQTHLNEKLIFTYILISIRNKQEN